MIFDNIVTLLVGLGLFGVIGLYGWYCTKKYKVPFGPAIVTDMTILNESYLVAITIGAMIASSIMAAVVHSPDVLAQPLFARMMIHGLIGVIGLVCILTLFHEIKKVFEKGLKPLFIVTRLLLVLVLTSLAITAPYANLILMAKNVGQADIFDLWWFSYRGGDPQIVGDIIEKLGYPRETTPWAIMQPSLCAELVLVVMHAGIIVIEGLRNISSSDRVNFINSKEVKFEAPKKEASKEVPKEEEKKEETKKEEKKDVKEIDNVFNFILNRFNYKGDKKDKTLKDLLFRMGQLTEQQQVKFVVKLTSLKVEAENIDQRKSDVSKEENKQKIIELIKGSPKDTSNPGLGFTLTQL